MHASTVDGHRPIRLDRVVVSTGQARASTLTETDSIEALNQKPRCCFNGRWPRTDKPEEPTRPDLHVRACASCDGEPKNTSGTTGTTASMPAQSEPPRQMRRLRAVFALSAVSVCLSAEAEANPKAITSKTTVAEFALECQHPAMKSHPDERMNICLTFLASAVHQIALAKRSSRCWQEVESGKASPMAISDALFYMATQPEEKGRPVGEALREVVVEVAAKSCK